MEHLHFFLIFTTVCTQWVSGAMVNFYVVPSSKLVSCLPSNNFAIKQLQSLKMTRNNGELLATASKGVVDSVLTSPDGSYKSMSHLDPQDTTKSYVRVVFDSPSKDDAGLYKCAISYLDWDDVLKQETVKKTISWDKSDNDHQSKSKKYKNTPFVGVSSDGTTRIEISPSNNLDALTKRVQVSCRPQFSGKIERILLLTLARGDGNVVAVVGRESPKLSDVKYIVESSLDKKIASKSFLKVIIPYPSEEDSGVYTCKMVYINMGGNMKQATVDGTLTLTTTDNPDQSHLSSVVGLTFQKLSSQEKIIQSLENTVSALTNRIDALAYKLGNQTSQMDDLEPRMALQKDNKFIPVAFVAKKKGSTYRIVKNASCIYETVDMNLGGAYDKKTGVFTAPTDGLYVFHLYVDILPTNSVSALIRVNGKTTGRVIAIEYGFPRSSSDTSLVRLKAKDKVDTTIVMWRESREVNLVFTGHRISKV